MLNLKTRDAAIRASRQIAADALLACAMLPAAWDRMVEHRGGYRSTASGADSGGGGQRTVTVDGEAVPVTVVEAAVLSGGPDTALAHLSALLGALERLYGDGGIVVRLTAQYYDGVLTQKELDALREDLVPSCANGAHTGFEPADRSSKYCRRCKEFLRANGGLLPDAELCAKAKWYDRDVQAALVRAKSRKGGRKVALVKRKGIAA